MAYPGAITTFPATTGTEVLGLMGSGVGLSPLINLMGVDLTAAETKLGSGASTPAANTLLYGTGAGTSAWQGLTSAQLLAILSDETGSGSAVFSNSPTIVTPTIASFTNAQHNHQNAAGGGQLTASSAITAGTVTNALLDTAAGGIGAAWQAYTPVWTSTGTAPTQGNVSLVGAYVQIGKTVHFRAAWTFGSTSAQGTGQYRFSLPVVATASYLANQSFAIGFYLNNAATAAGTCVSRFITTSTISFETAGGAEIGAAAPAAWQTNDYVRFSGTYEAA